MIFLLAIHPAFSFLFLSCPVIVYIKIVEFTNSYKTVRNILVQILPKTSHHIRKLFINFSPCSTMQHIHSMTTGVAIFTHCHHHHQAEPLPPLQLLFCSWQRWSPSCWQHRLPSRVFMDIVLTICIWTLIYASLSHMPSSYVYHTPPCCPIYYPVLVSCPLSSLLLQIFNYWYIPYCLVHVHLLWIRRIIVCTNILIDL